MGVRRSNGPKLAEYFHSLLKKAKVPLFSPFFFFFWLSNCLLVLQVSQTKGTGRLPSHGNLTQENVICVYVQTSGTIFKCSPASLVVCWSIAFTGTWATWTWSMVTFKKRRRPTPPPYPLHCGIIDFNILRITETTQWRPEGGFLWEEKGECSAPTHSSRFNNTYLY